MTVNAANNVDVDLAKLFAAIAANWRRILVVALVATAVAFVLAWLATPKYRAETRILIETRESQFTRTGNDGSDSQILDSEGVASQVQVISSTDILKKVAKQYDLAKLKEFDAQPSLFGRLLVIAGLETDPGAISADERVLNAFREKLKVFRVDNSRVIVIQFSSQDPKLAAEIPNALADEYIAVQRDAKLQSNDDATGWLEPQIAKLRERVREAEEKVAKFRGQSDLLVGQNNSTLASQQLSDMSSELSRVRASRAAAEAKSQAIRAAIKDGTSLETIPDVLSSPLIQRLRERQVQLQADLADLSTTLLGNHPRILALKSQLADLSGQIRNEAQKVLDGLDTEAETAKAREQSLQGDLDELKTAIGARADQESVELRALERDAASERDLLESYMTRYREASSRTQGNYLPADARIFSRAVVPAAPYFPKIVPIVGATFVASLLVMGIGILLRELFSGRAMRPADEEFEPVTEVVMSPRSPAVPYAKPLPPQTQAEPAPAREREPAAARETEPVAAREAAPAEAAPVSELGEISTQGAAEKLIATGAPRAVFVSPEGDEGAAASVLVAREIADAGLRVLLLDMTSSGAASRPMLESRSYPGITNLLASEAQFTDVIHADLYSETHVIPVGTADPARAMRAAERLPIILESLSTAYDIVIVECGPAEPEALRRLVSPDTQVMMAVIEPSERDRDGRGRSRRERHRRAHPGNAERGADPGSAAGALRGLSSVRVLDPVWACGPRAGQAPAHGAHELPDGFVVLDEAFDAQGSPQAGHRDTPLERQRRQQVEMSDLQRTPFALVGFVADAEIIDLEPLLADIADRLEEQKVAGARIHQLVLADGAELARHLPARNARSGDRPEPSCDLQPGKYEARRERLQRIGEQTPEEGMNPLVREDIRYAGLGQALVLHLEEGVEQPVDLGLVRGGDDAVSARLGELALLRPVLLALALGVGARQHRVEAAVEIHGERDIGALHDAGKHQRVGEPGPLALLPLEQQKIDVGARSPDASKKRTDQASLVRTGEFRGACGEIGGGVAPAGEARDLQRPALHHFEHQSQSRSRGIGDRRHHHVGAALELPRRQPFGRLGGRMHGISAESPIAFERRRVECRDQRLRGGRAFDRGRRDVPPRFCRRRPRVNHTSILGH